MTPRLHREPLIIRRVDAIPVALPLKVPMKMAGVTISRADNLVVRIEARNGIVGWGEAASAPTMTGDTLGGLVAAVRDHLAPMLLGRDAFKHPALVPALRRVLIGNTGAHSAVEMALLDLIGRAAHVKVIDIIVPEPKRRQVAPMWLLGRATLAANVAEAHEMAARGFHLLKIKIGAKPLDGDIATTLAVRAALPDMPLCADANGGLRLADARRYLRATRKAGLKFVEQPMPYDDFKSLAALARTSSVPIGVDEGIHSVADIDQSARCGAGGVSLKLIKLGGITAACDAARLCQRHRLKVNVAAKIAESSLASAAAVHLACAVPNIDWGVSLTHFYLAEDIVRDPLPLQDGMVALPQGHGLGVDVEENKVARFRVKEFGRV